MKLPRSKLVTKIIVFALIVYAGISLITLWGRTDAIRAEEYALRRAVAEMEITNSQLQHSIENHDDPAVIEEIARQDLGLVRDDEIIISVAGSGNDNPD